MPDTATISCLLCGKLLRQIIPGEPEQAAWSGGGAHEFVPGYGSRHDMTTFVIALCDSCIDAKVADGSMIIQARPV